MISFGQWYRERIRTNMFSSKAYPGRPFRKPDWIGVAFDQDKNHWGAPEPFWRALLTEAKQRFGESSAFFVGANDVPPGVEALESEGSFDSRYECLVEFLSTDHAYLSRMYIVGGSERWAYWQDQDFALFGGDPDLMSPVFDLMGGRASLLQERIRQFDVQNGEDPEMVRYLTALLGSE